MHPCSLLDLIPLTNFSRKHKSGWYRSIWWKMNKRELVGALKYRFSKSITSCRYFSSDASMPSQNACKYNPLLRGSSTLPFAGSLCERPTGDDPLYFVMNLRMSLYCPAILTISSRILASPGWIKLLESSEICGKQIELRKTYLRCQNTLTVNSKIGKGSVSALIKDKRMSWIILINAFYYEANTSKTPDIQFISFVLLFWLISSPSLN